MVIRSYGLYDLMSVCPADFENLVSKMLVKHMELLRIIKIEF